MGIEAQSNRSTLFMSFLVSISALIGIHPSNSLRTVSAVSTQSDRAKQSQTWARWGTSEDVQADGVQSHPTGINALRRHYERERWCETKPTARAGRPCKCEIRNAKRGMRLLPSYLLTFYLPPVSSATPVPSAVTDCAKQSQTGREVVVTNHSTDKDLPADGQVCETKPKCGLPCETDPACPAGQRRAQPALRGTGDLTV